MAVIVDRDNIENFNGNKLTDVQIQQISPY